MPTESEKIASLQGQENAKVCQVLAIYWGSPDGTIYYANKPFDNLTEFRGISAYIDNQEIDTRLVLNEGFLIPFELSPDLSDEEISLRFIDEDLEMQRLFSVHGEGVKVEIFYYYPEQDLFISRWFGQLSPPKQATYFQFSSSASSGFSSRLVPVPRRAFIDLCSSPFGGNPSFTTQAQINELKGCPYNRGIGGAVGNLNGGVPYTTCPKTKAGCNTRLGDSLSYLGFDVTASPIVSDSKGNLAASRGNSTTLKRPLRRVYGYKIIRDLDLLAWRKEPNVSTPDKGFVSGQWAVCEGSVSNVFDLRINDGAVNVQATNYRTGELRQPPTSYASDISNFSGTALVFARLGWVNANQTSVPQLQTQISVHGANDVRVYSDEDTYTEQFTYNRVWCLLDVYANKRWGRGYDYSRFNLTDWGEVANWTNEEVLFTDVNGVDRIHTRTTFCADLQGRLSQEQIIDICRAGRISPPFQYNGKWTIRAFRKATTDELTNAKVFADSGDSRNIFKAENKYPSLTYSQQSARELANEIKLTFEDGANYHIERPLTFIDEDAQMRAGEAFGDTSLRPIQKVYSGLGVSNENEASKLGHALLHLGEFDSGGLANNLRITFLTWTTEVLGLTKYDIIKVESALLEVFGFDYFRVMNIRQQARGLVEITAQAYPVDFYDTFETEPPDTPEPPTLPPVDNPEPPTFGDYYYRGGLLYVKILNA